jgi:hypothetical protein
MQTVQLLAVYSSPPRLVEYADGRRYHIAALHFEAEPIGGAFTISDKTPEVGYFAWDTSRTWACWQRLWNGSEMGSQGHLCPLYEEAAQAPRHVTCQVKGYRGPDLAGLMPQTA